MSTIYEQLGRSTGGGYRDVDPLAVAAMRASGKAAARIIDVREPYELSSDLGHIQGVESVPLDTLESAARSWNKDDAIVLVCRSGGRSARAATALVVSGFRHVMNMSGGMLAWKAANLPIVRTHG